MNSTPLNARLNEILERLERLRVRWKPSPRTPDEANTNPLSLTELEAERKVVAEMNDLYDELIAELKEAR